MKYRVLREMPFAKAGAEVLYKFQNDSYPIFKAGHICTILHIECNKTDLNRLIEEGWIEEVKPREFYLIQAQDLGGVWHIVDYAFNIDNARDKATSRPENARFIKVREVIE